MPVAVTHQVTLSQSGWALNLREHGWLIIKLVWWKMGKETQQDLACIQMQKHSLPILFHPVVINILVEKEIIEILFGITAFLRKVLCRPPIWEDNLMLMLIHYRIYWTFLFTVFSLSKYCCFSSHLPNLEGRKAFKYYPSWLSPTQEHSWEVAKDLISDIKDGR